MSYLLCTSEKWKSKQTNYAESLCLTFHPNRNWHHRFLRLSWLCECDPPLPRSRGPWSSETFLQPWDLGLIEGGGWAFHSTWLCWRRDHTPICIWWNLEKNEKVQFTCAVFFDLRLAEPRLAAAHSKHYSKFVFSSFCIFLQDFWLKNDEKWVLRVKDQPVCVNQGLGISPKIAHKLDKHI